MARTALSLIPVTKDYCQRRAPSLCPTVATTPLLGHGKRSGKAQLARHHPHLRHRTFDRMRSITTYASVGKQNRNVHAATISADEGLELAQSQLENIALDGKVTVPTYNRELTPDRPVMMHLGVGGFFRSHQALYLHNLLEKGSNWAFVGMGILDFDKKMYETLKAQDYLYTVASKGDGHKPEYTVVGSMLDMCYAPDDKKAAVERMAAEQTKIVSLTITEKGYCWDSDGNLDMNNLYIKGDLEDITQPHSAIGYLVAALKLRKERGMKPFTVLSCDNMPENGHVAKKMCTTLARAVEPELSDWIEANVPFPVTMVDRITPITTQEDIDELAADTGIVDGWPVVAEDFMQWVVEDKFVDGERPDYEAVGALVVEDVLPYEFMKLRLLNGGHSALSYAAYMLGHREVHLAMQDDRVLTFLQCYFAEVKDTVPPVPGVDIDEYKDTLVKRFSNTNIKDQVQRLAQDGSAKLYNTMKDPILELLAAGKPLDTVALAIAAYGRYMTQIDEDGEAITVLDPLQTQLTPLACDMFAKGENASCLGMESSRRFVHAVFGTELSENDDFMNVVEAWACIVRDVETRGALEGLCQTLVNSEEIVYPEVIQSCVASYDLDLDAPMPTIAELAKDIQATQDIQAA